jgi:hypothetical protein
MKINKIFNQVMKFLIIFKSICIKRMQDVLILHSIGRANRSESQFNRLVVVFNSNLNVIARYTVKIGKQS